MVLLHHPDKRKAKGEEVIQDDDYFTCITKAYEILGGYQGHVLVRNPYTQGLGFPRLH